MQKKKKVFSRCILPPSILDELPFTLPTKMYKARLNVPLLCDFGVWKYRTQPMSEGCVHGEEEPCRPSSSKR